MRLTLARAKHGAVDIMHIYCIGHILRFETKSGPLSVMTGLALDIFHIAAAVKLYARHIRSQLHSYTCLNALDAAYALVSEYEVMIVTLSRRQFGASDVLAYTLGRSKIERSTDNAFQLARRN